MEVGDVVAERFEVEAVLGRGGMGVVYRARDRARGDAAVVKVLEHVSGKEARRFEREALALGRIDHPAVVRYRAHGVVAGLGPWLAMDCLEGEDLARRLRGSALELSEVLVLGARVADALDAVHAAGMVHRDVKPANVFLPGGDVHRATLLDFGIAQVPDELGLSRMTAQGAMIGTPGFLAPEQVRAFAIDARADLFALGAVLYQCVAGRPAFEGRDIMAVVAKVLLEDPPGLRAARPEAPEALAELVSSMLQKRPDRRPPDAATVGRALREIAAGEMGRPTLETIERVSLLSGEEQRVVSVVLARPGEPRAGDHEVGSASFVSISALHHTLAPWAARYGAQLEVLVEGSVLALVPADGGPSSAALRAARLALAIRRAMPAGVVVVATERTIAGRAPSVGALLDRAAASLSEVSAADVALDEASAALLDDRFDLERVGGGFVLRAEREASLASRAHLGPEGPLIGRHAELRALREAAAAVRSARRPRAVVVAGVPGIGKSRLARELLGDEDPHLRLIARGDPMRAGSSLSALAPAVRVACGVGPRATLAHARAAVLARVAACVPPARVGGVAAFLGEVAGVPLSDEASAELRSARADALVIAERVREAFVGWVAAEAALGPVVVVLEDLHAVDRASLRLVDEALRCVEGPLLVVALARPEADVGHPGAFAGRDVERIELGPLDDAEATRLLAARGLRGARAAEVVGRAGGNPFVLEELGREALRGRVGLPRTVLGSVEARLLALGDELRRVLRAASVFGLSFHVDGVAELLGPEEGDGLDARIAQLVAEELVTPRRTSALPGQRELAFEHALLREAAYATLTPEDLRRGHRRAARWLARAGEVDPVVMATHLEHAGLGDEAAEQRSFAARAALAANDLAGTIAHAVRGLEDGGATEVRGMLHLRLAEACTWRGEPRRAREAAAAALEVLPEGSDAWVDAAAAFFDASCIGGDGRGTEALLKRLRDVDGADPARVAAGLSRAATALVILHRADLAARALHVAEDLAGRVDDAPASMRGHLHHARAVLALARGDLGEALDFFPQAIGALSEAGATRFECGARGNLGGKLLEVGAVEDALDVLEHAVELAQRAGDAYPIAYDRMLLGIASAAAGDLERARALLEEAVVATVAIGEARFEGYARAELALLLSQQGDRGRAIEEARRSVAAAEGHPSTRSASLGVLARLLLPADPAEALARAEEGMAELARETMLYGESTLRLAHVDALDACGRSRDAAAALVDAARALHRRARLIDAAPLRASFLTRVPDNARTVERARAAGVWPG